MHYWLLDRMFQRRCFGACLVVAAIVIVAKRKLMGQIAEQFADCVILCDDNPRSERSDDIIDDILDGIADTSKVHIEPKRDQAILHALHHASPHDVILIAGKGHEDYQIYGDTRLVFSDIEFVKSLIKI